MSKILKYIVLLSSFIGFFCFNAFSQGEDVKEEKIPLYQGLKIEVDVYSMLRSALNKESYSFEANAQVNLLEKFFPILEMGLAGANKTSINNYGFRTNGLFSKIGIDYNLLKPNAPGTKIHRYFFVGGRYGFSHFSYDVTNISIANGYWGEDGIRNFEDVKTTKHWLEVVGGLRVEVLRNIYMGWSARLKIKLGEEKYGEVSPWFIPGIGIKTGGNWGFNYTIGYKF